MSQSYMIKNPQTTLLNLTWEKNPKQHYKKLSSIFCKWVLYSCENNAVFLRKAQCQVYPAIWDVWWCTITEINYHHLTKLVLISWCLPTRISLKPLHIANPCQCFLPKSSELAAGTQDILWGGEDIIQPSLLLNPYKIAESGHCCLKSKEVKAIKILEVKD